MAARSPELATCTAAPRSHALSFVRNNFCTSAPTFCEHKMDRGGHFLPRSNYCVTEPPLTDSPLCENLSIARYLDSTECIPFVTHTFRALYSGNLRIPLCENLSIARYLDGTECIPFLTHTFRALYSGNLRISYSIQDCITQLR